MSQISFKSKQIFIFILLATVILVIDQLSKYPFSISWNIGQSKPILPFLAFTYVKNTGGLFGMFQGNAFVLGLISLTIAIGIVIYTWRMPREQSIWHYVAMGFLLGGALGNVLDRLRLGFVVDFFDLQYQGQNIWPVFNVADIAVNVAIGLFILLMLIESIQPEKNSQESTQG